MLKSRLSLLPLLLLLVVAFGGRAARAQRAQPATFAAVVTPATARPGETVTVTVTATIQEPWHVYSLSVPPNGPQPTVVTVTAGDLKPVGAATESLAKTKRDPNFDMDIGSHAGAATFTQRLMVPADAAPIANVPVTVGIRYQACTDSMCLPPREVEVTPGPTLAIEAGAARAEYSAPAAATTDEGVLVADSNTDGSLAGFLLAAFGAGLLALVTPCVFPMIPVTLAFFTKQAAAKEGTNGGSAQGAVVRLAGLYSLGIVIAFTAIGAVLAATVGAGGAQNLATNPWVNLGFAILFVVFALALLEVVELRLPQGMHGLTAAGRRHGGTLGVLGMGLTFVVAAFTCTAPFIGTILVAAASASTGSQWLRPILGMAVFAAALALPFFLLALFPGWLARLPRSGAWLSTVKGTMGFVELAAAAKFLSNADLVWQWKLLTQPVFLALWAIIALAAALWLLGILRIGLSAPEGRPTLARSAWAASFVAVALYCFWGLTGRPLQRDLVAFLPPEGYGAVSGTQTAEASDGLNWHDTLEAGLAQAQAENKPVFIDFTGYTCTNCRWMEKNVFPDPAVRSELGQFVLIKLYTDGGDNWKQNQSYQEKTFGDVALPLYGILGPDGKVAARSAGITREPGKFAAFLRQGREREAQARSGGVTTTASAAGGTVLQ